MPVGAVFDLSDAQRDKIKKRSRKLADEFEKLIAKVREESQAIVKEELNDKHWAKVEQY